MLAKKTLVSLALALLAFAGACSVDELGTTGDFTGGGGSGDAVYNFRETLSWGAAWPGSPYQPLTLGLTPGNDTTEIGVSWYFHGGTAGRSTHVRFFRGTLEAGSGLIEATGTARSAATGFVTHQATVRGLRPGSLYQYSVSGDGVNWSALHELRIPPNTRSFRFAIVGDPQIIDGEPVDSTTRYPSLDTLIADGWKMTMERIVNREPAFILSMGDQISQEGSGEAAWADFFAPPGLRNLPFAPTAGNHDRAPPNSLPHHFVIPNEQTIPGIPLDDATWANYFFLYNNVLFVGLNTSGGQNHLPDARVAGGQMISKFRQTLRNATARHAGRFDWLIVFHHKSTASVAYHVANLDIMYWVQHGFEALMSEQFNGYYVDFVLAGHDHVYARSFPLAGKGGGLVSVPDETRGGEWHPTIGGGSYVIRNPVRGQPIYVTFTSSSGEGFYSVVTDRTFPFPHGTRPFNQANPVYPFLGVNPATGEPTLAGSLNYLEGNLPVSNAVFHQPRIPSYTIVEVGPSSITFRTYPIGTVSGQHPGAPDPFSFTAGVPYDSFTVIRD